MDAALQYYLGNLDTMRGNMRECKLRLAKNLLAIPDVFINGPAPEEGAPHILNASFMGVRGEVLLHALEEKKIYVSTGSACSAHKKGKNRILNAMGVIGDRQEGAIRFSFSAFNTPEEMDETAEAIAGLLAMLRRFRRR
ncbi:MAG: aminotransferase class V-fold PLP-dependent enzyme, partial [Clostridia bacterium]|nr:aminotransferase class V-fold PLP-dependent enzyme [Clostridia bacterium]